MAEGRKQAISLRLNAGDIRRIKEIADRLGVNDSDVVRFGIKLMLHQMLPLTNRRIRGRQLVPLLAELGPDAVRHFDLDATTLDEIINGDAPPEERVDAEDIGLVTLVSARESYAQLSLRALAPRSKPPPEGDRRDASPLNAMRRHLYAKYELSSARESNPAVESLAKLVGRKGGD